MKKLLYSTAILAAMAVAFASCGGDDPVDEPGQTIEVTANVAGSAQLGYIKRVRAATIDSTTEQTIATSAFTAAGINNFSLTLADSPIARYLRAINSEGFTVSPINTRAAYADFEGFTSESGEFVYATHYAGLFFLERWSSTATTDVSTFVEFIYAENDVTIRGTIGDTDSCRFSPTGLLTWAETWNADLKKGWNRLYVTIVDSLETIPNPVERTTFSTTPVTGLTWVFYGDDPANPANDVVSPATKRMQERRAKRGSSRSNVIPRNVRNDRR